jgi:hypothetical protein
MDINIMRGVEHRLLEVAVLHVVAAAPKEMAGPAIRSLRLTHVLSNVRQVDGGVRHSRTPGGFHICRAVVVAREAVDIQRIVEIERCVGVPVPYVALVAALFVPGNADAEIVQDIPLPDGPDSFPLNVFRPPPIPVGGVHYFGVAAVVALNTGSGDLLGLAEVLPQLRKHRMIDRGVCLLCVSIFQTGERCAFNAILVEGRHDQPGEERQRKE